MLLNVRILDIIMFQIWSINSHERKITSYYLIQIYRPIKFFLGLSEGHFLLGFDSGDFDVYNISSVPHTDGGE
jgi:hypothetical protein